MAPHPAPDPAGHERGSITIWFALSTFVMIVLVGLAVDLSGQIHAQQHARNVAAQAARVGGQELNAPVGIRGTGAHANTALAVNAAQAHLNAAGLSGMVSLQSGGTRLVVTTSDVYSTKFLGIIGIGSMPVTGSAEARIVRAVQGGEQ